jgi:quercetin dioxygenase-like cupin family protein
LEEVMNRVLLLLVSCAALVVGGMTLAQHAGEGRVKVTRLSRRDIVEKLDGKDAQVTVEEVTLGPGQEVPPHRHAGPVFGYVLEGDYEHAINDDPITSFRAGDTFYEPSGCVHRVTRNPSRTAQTRLLAVIVYPRAVREVTVPVGAKKK